MNKFDISDNQFWILVSGGIFTTLIVISILINSNSNYGKRIKMETEQSKIDKGYVEVIETTCVKYTTEKIWILEDSIEEMK